MALFDPNRFNSHKQEWETPDDLFNILNDEFKFTFDLAADYQNKKCENYFSIDDNALTKTWSGVCWLNPPYGNKGFKIKDWVKKAYLETLNKDTTVVMLIPARTNTKWWNDYCMKACEVRFLLGRPVFKGCIHGLPQPLAIIIFKSNNKKTKFETQRIR